ncbi:hypothetical protein [Photobacterium rosenbergii]|uniref:hypothetical protein n=1 Tax=Photobacterium rosenbergii TaxID=294936 RepID=UPI001C9A088D|nr:hypothetical protein [Photobacterium rosenbergii]MBY5946065.1 hypothetical protein [Photobacterium rosenbergii]
MKCIAVWLGTNYTNGQHKKIAEKIGEDIRKNRMGDLRYKILILFVFIFNGDLMDEFRLGFEQKHQQVDADTCLK